MTPIISIILCFAMFRGFLQMLPLFLKLLLTSRKWGHRVLLEEPFSVSFQFGDSNQPRTSISREVSFWASFVRNRWVKPLVRWVSCYFMRHFPGKPHGFVSRQKVMPSVEDASFSRASPMDWNPTGHAKS